MPKYGVHGFLLEGWRATVTAVRQAAGPDVVAIGFLRPDARLFDAVTWTSEQIMAGVSAVRPFYLLLLQIFLIYE
jgi:hypothetical protein